MTRNTATDGGSMYKRMFCAGMAGCTADIFTYPLDTLKVWLQVHGEEAKKPILTSTSSTRKESKLTPHGSVRGQHVLVAPARNTSIVAAVVSGVKKNGARSLYGGLSAGLQRQMAFCAVRIGFYDNVKNFYCGMMGNQFGGRRQFPQRIMAGTTTALFAVIMFQPTEVVKIRMQAQAKAPPSQHLYRSTLQAYKYIFSGGLREAWRGLGANSMRLGVVNVSELVTYDIVKEMILDYKLMSDNPNCHFASALISGLVTTVVASPIDVVKTRYMNAQSEYKGLVHCASKMLKREGAGAFYKGFVPAYLRLGSWNIAMFLSYEQYKRLFYAPKPNVVST